MTEPLRVIDCSSFQGAIAWEAVKAAGVSGAIAKCCEGIGTVDPQFSRNWPEIARVGLGRGAYAFGRPDLGNAPEAEATFFLGAVGSDRLAPGDILCLDLEVGSGDLSGWALAWLHHVEQAVGFKPAIYSFPSFIQEHLRDRALADFPLWLAAYGPPTTMPPCPAPWGQYVLWQWTDTSAVPGIPDACDESLIHRDLAGLKALGKPAAAAPPQPTPAPSPQPHKVVITKTMMLRKDPHHDDIYDPAQLVYAKAVLDVVGPEVGGWLPVHAGTRTGYVLKANTRPVP